MPSAGAMGDGNDTEWREYNIHGENEQVDIFASTEVEYDTLYYTCRDGRLQQANDGASDDKSIVVRSEKNWHKSTGMSVCRGSELLCSYLLKHPDAINNKRTLELGCGTGLVGIVIMKHLHPASMLLTDGDLEVLKNMRHNVQENGLKPDENHLACPQLIWGKKSAQKFKDKNGAQDVIMAADCLYIPQSIANLWELVDQVLTNKGVFLYVAGETQCDFDRVVKSGLEFSFVHCPGENWADDLEENKQYPVRLFRRKI